jgi:hypothetical protein
VQGTGPGRDGRPAYVLIIDQCDVTPGKMSVTNTAEAVVKELLIAYPGHRIAYMDTEGQIDELRHDGVSFTGFGHGFVP